MVILLVSGYECLRCGHRWIPRTKNFTDNKPRICPKCKLAYYDISPFARKSIKCIRCKVIYIPTIETKKFHMSCKTIRTYIDYRDKSKVIR